MKSCADDKADGRKWVLCVGNDRFGPIGDPTARTSSGAVMPVPFPARKSDPHIDCNPKKDANSSPIERRGVCERSP